MPENPTGVLESWSGDTIRVGAVSASVIISRVRATLWVERNVNPEMKLTQKEPVHEEKPFGADSNVQPPAKKVFEFKRV